MMVLDLMFDHKRLPQFKCNFTQTLSTLSDGKDDSLLSSLL